MERWKLPPRVLAAFECGVAALWFATVLFLLLAALKAQVARAADFPSDLGSGTLLFGNATGYAAAAPLSTDVRISIAGIVARVAVTQRFRNTGGGWSEALYAFPLPDGAAIDRLGMQIGERVIEGEIRARAQAERIYGEARAAGQRASLVRQTTPNLFTTAVANIGPGETIDITIEYLETARYETGELSLRFPMTFTPRYGATETDASGSSATPLAGAIARQAAAPLVAPPSADVHTDASIRVVLAPGLPLAAVEARGHAARVTALTDRYVIETDEPRVAMDRDFVIAWRPKAGAVPAATALTQTIDGTTYALLMIVPPADTQAARGQPREVIFVVDTSGSMGGQPIVQAQAALEHALGTLRGNDRFNVFQFNSATSSLYRTPVQLTADTHAAALAWVRRLAATGGTEMEPAIRAALAQPVTPGYVRQVIFVTDGAVAHETRLFSAIKQGLRDARLFTIGIGAAPNLHFMRKAAQFGRGTYTQIGDAAAVESVLRQLFDQLEHVALADVLVDWPDAVEVYPQHVPDLYAGEPIVVVASFAGRGPQPLEAHVFGRMPAAAWSQSVLASGDSLPGIAALWARRKIESLLDSRVDGVDAALIEKLVTDVALEHGLVSPYTSLVAVDKTPARSAAAALERQAVGNMRPAGAVWTALPQTASAAPLYRWLGLALLVIAAAGLGLGRRGERPELAQR